MAGEKIIGLEKTPQPACFEKGHSQPRTSKGWSVDNWATTYRVDTAHNSALNVWFAKGEDGVSAGRT